MCGRLPYTYGPDIYGPDVYGCCNHGLDGGVLREISSLYLNIVDQCLEVPL